MLRILFGYLIFSSLLFSTDDSLPTPPYSDLKSRDLSPSSSEAILAPNASIDDVVNAIKKIYETSPRRSAVEHLSSKLFEKLLESNDPETIIMTVIASASCHHPLSKDMCRLLLRSPYPVIQLSSIQALYALNTHEADDILIDALRSDFLLVRFEAAYILAKKRSPHAFYHIDALSQKIPPELKSYIPELFALEGSSLSIQRLKQFLVDPDESLVTETLLAIGRHKIFALSPHLVTFEAHSPALLEALSFSLQIVDSTASKERLKNLSIHQNPLVAIQASLSLVLLGETSYQSTIESYARQGNLFALCALSSCPSPSDSIQPKEKNSTFSMNQGLLLLSQKDKASLPYILSILSLSNETILSQAPSPGRSLSYLQTNNVSIFPQNIRPSLQEESLRIQEQILTSTIELDETAFLEIASHIFQEGYFELYPCLLELLANKQSDTSIDLLRQESIRLGAPYNRAYATLCLIKQHQLEIDTTTLLSILNLSREKSNQSWRFFLPWMDTNSNEEQRSFLQQATMSARLYIEALSTLAECGSPQAIEILVSELSLAPKKYLPFVVSALLHASL
jgi:hypothetical protein